MSDTDQDGAAVLGTTAGCKTMSDSKLDGVTVIDLIRVQPHKVNGPTADNCSRMIVEVPWEMHLHACAVAWGKEGDLWLVRMRDLPKTGDDTP